jgi:hypothetical protein
MKALYTILSGFGLMWVLFRSFEVNHPILSIAVFLVLFFLLILTIGDMGKDWIADE